MVLDENWVIYNSYSKEGDKGNDEHFHIRKKLDTIEDHHNKQTHYIIIEDLSCWWVTSLKNGFLRQRLDTIEDHHNKQIYIN